MGRGVIRLSLLEDLSGWSGVNSLDTGERGSREISWEAITILPWPWPRHIAVAGSDGGVDCGGCRDEEQLGLLWIHLDLLVIGCRRKKRKELETKARFLA